MPSIRAMISLNGTVLSGFHLKASIGRSLGSTIRCNCCCTSVGSASCLLKEVVGSTAAGVTTKTEIAAAINMQGAIGAAEIIAQNSLSSPPSVDKVSNVVADAAGSDVKGSKQGGKKSKGDLPVSVYEEAVLAPKLDKSSKPRRPIFIAVIADLQQMSRGRGIIFLSWIRRKLLFTWSWTRQEHRLLLSTHS